MWWCLSFVYLALLSWRPCQSGQADIDYNVCENITVPMCQGLPYNCTKMPNILHHQTQYEAGLELHQWQPLVNMTCSPSLRLFLCSVYLPRYQVGGTTTPPCRTVCEKARQGCVPVLQKFGFNWPESFNCSKFPQRGEIACMDEGGQVVKTPLVTTVCEPLKLPMCKTNVSNTTNVPNLVGHTTQDQAIGELQQRFQRVLANSSDCSTLLKPFICSIYLPRCHGSSGTVPPCRSLCRKVQQTCSPLMHTLHMSWPVKCGIFPKPSQRVCLNKDGALEKPPPVTSPSTTSSSTCEPITVRMCRDIGYNFTKLPNPPGLKKQEKAMTKAVLNRIYPLIKMNCSPFLKLFLCSLYMSTCETGGTVRKPCRSLCQKVKSGCEPALKSGRISWPDELSCRKFPKRSVQACLAEDGTVKDYDHVHSATFPVTLKCQLPGKLFRIRKIVITDGSNKSKRLSRDKLRKAAARCNTTRRKVRGGYECKLTRGPRKLEIGSDTVISSVSVMYKCL